MSNEYFNHSDNRITQGHLARSSQVNNIADEISVGFDKLPSPDALTLGSVNYVHDTGAANLYEVALSPTITSYTEGLRISVKIANGTTGASTLAVDGLAAQPIIRQDGNATQDGDILAGSIVDFIYDGTSFQIMSSAQVMVSAAETAMEGAEAAQIAAETAQGFSEDARDDSALSAAYSQTKAELSQYYAELSALGANALPDTTGKAGKTLRVDPGESTVSWENSDFVGYSSRTSNTVLTIEDNNKIIDLDGTFTQTFNACADLKEGWSVTLRNVGTGTIVIDPDGSETVDSLTSYSMYKGESRMFFCDGTELRSVVVKSFRERIDVTGDRIIPPGYKSFGRKLVSASGGAGSGMRSDTAVIFGGRGGAGGGMFIDETSNFTVGGTVTITIGAKGVGGASVTTNDTIGNPGTNGGDTSMIGAGFNITVKGGKGGKEGYSSGSTSNITGGGMGDAPTLSGLVYVSGWRPGGSGQTAEYGGGGPGAYVSTPGTYQLSGGSVFGGGAGGCGAGYNTTATTKSSPGLSLFGNDGGAAGDVGVNGAVGGSDINHPPAGGGGGGASRNGTPSGKGADGGDGFVEWWGVI